MKDAGLKIRVDAVGNTFGLWEGTDPHSGILLGLVSQYAVGLPN